MFKWHFHILIFAISGKYQNKEKPLKRQRKLGLVWCLIVSIPDFCPLSYFTYIILKKYAHNALISSNMVIIL